MKEVPPLRQSKSAADLALEAQLGLGPKACYNSRMGWRERAKRPGYRYLSLVLAALLGGAYWRESHPPKPLVTKAEISMALAGNVGNGLFPATVELAASDGKIRDYLPQYTLDLESQRLMDGLFQTYKPDYGAFVAIDAKTGKILSLLSYSRQPNDMGNLSLKATFPAASVFKLVTAAAAVDQNKARPDTVIAFNGANHTLYRRNVTQKDMNRWTRFMTIKEAFAKSVNTVFAKIGVFVLKPNEIQDYARRFKFNEPIHADVPVEPGTITLEEGNDWSVAELASGFNRVALMSPLQGALMAAAIVNEGRMMEPFVVESLSDGPGNVVYTAATKTASTTMSAGSALQIRSLMRETVAAGTSRKSFRPLLRDSRYRDLEVGGKSGSLRGDYPKGKCDWFVGYAMNGDQKIAVAALTINEDQWRVKSSYLARRFIEDYFDPKRFKPPSQTASLADR